MNGRGSEATDKLVVRKMLSLDEEIKSGKAKPVSLQDFAKKHKLKIR